jgi:hypothetical protein
VWPSIISLNTGGATPFFIACQNGHVDAVKLFLGDMPPGRIDLNRITTDMTTPLFMASQHGHNEVVRLLLSDERIDNVNGRSDTGATAMLIACENGQVEVVKMLLACPRVDVNLAQRVGATPFLMACQNGRGEVARLLLADDRVNINLHKNDSCTPLWFASQNGHLEVVQQILVSGREVNITQKSAQGPGGWNEKTASEIAKLMGTNTPADLAGNDLAKRRTANCPQISLLLGSFERNPGEVRRKLCTLPGLREPFVGEVFAMIIFLSDNFLAIKKNKESETKNEAGAKRFFKIASELHFDLQMVLCNRLYNSPKDLVLSKHSESAFKKLARKSLWDQ